MIKHIVFTSIFILSSNSVRAIPFTAQDIVISGPSQTAVDAGLSIHLKGGNIIDITVATGLALAVTSPYYASLGGGGLAVIKTQSMSQPMTLDFREVAPKQSHPQMYKSQDSSSESGGLAVAVPGIVAGYFEMHKKYGHLKWRDVIEPAIQLAKKGFRVTGEWYEMTHSASNEFNSEGMKGYLRSSKGLIPLPGTLFKQPALASALSAIQKQGRDGFYRGKVAQDLVHTIKKNKGIMGHDDLESYQPRWLEPILVQAKQKTVALMPPPSSGGALIALGLHFLECAEVEKTKVRSLEESLALTRILNSMFAHRNLLADPQYFPGRVSKILETQNQTEWCAKLKTQKNLDEKWMTSQIDKLRREAEAEANSNPQRVELNESRETTHFSVLNSKGEGTAVTITLNGNYGSKVITENYAIALNNEMDDFNSRPGQPNQFGLVQGVENEVRPGKRPLSSMSPTLVLENNEVIASLGSPGGPRITSAVFQVLYRWLFRNYDIDRAIQAPRLHQQYIPKTLFIDPYAFNPEMIESLKKQGWNVEESRVAKVYGTVRTKIQNKSLLQGAFDSRGEGGVAGE